MGSFDSSVRHGHHSTRRVALTGGIATGKSHVLAVLSRAGVPTIDTDQVARAVVEPGTPALAAIVHRFGPANLDASGALDRRALADIVFADPRSRLDLEAIVHPAVRTATEEWFAALPPSTPFAVVAIPLLFETGRERDFDAVVVTACTPETQLRRLMARDRLTESDARRRIEAQLPLDEKVRRADFVIDTSGTYDKTDAQVDALLDRLRPDGEIGRPPDRLLR
jgi:dephospho-CoA kinase